MKRHFLYTGFVLFMGFGAFAQNQNAIKFSKTITKDNAYKHLSVLASDEYEGRETGKKGAWMAADYIKTFFKSLGLKGPVNGDYFQPVDLVTNSLTQILTIDGQPAEAIKDFYIPAQTVSSKGFTFNTSTILFAGYGLNKEGYNDFAGQNVAGKVVLILKSGQPGEAPAAANPRAETIALNAKIKFLSESKALAVLVVDPGVDNMTANLKSYLTSESLTMKSKESIEKMNAPQGMVTINISSATANKILAVAGTSIDALKKQIADSGKPATKELKVMISASGTKVEKKVRGENVLGFLEGSDPKLKKEVLVVTGHYDHIGLTTSGDDKVNNGADDDGSGTTGVLMVAEAFAKAKKAGKGPKRSILFMTVVGEEKGLWGSEWYSENPVFPLENTIADLNIDMIGRGDKDHATDNNFVYIIGSDMLSSDLDKIGKKANKDYVNINLDERYNNRTDPNRFYYRSDHYNFAKHGIPVIFYFNGVHPEYHMPGDEISKIDFPMLAKRAQLVYFTAWELANGLKRPAVDKNEDGTPKK
ncbi:M28 family peptidase [Pedobacter metabolipauper]|uniref:Peptidase M28-like protein n=1 Tax=Pedobacter metabolipauper TaxID=425513 RepID=A0A4R6SX91_9SPHI|nr:M28 family peptidase [Pedobacter metabolipauper]TDQ10081.1 peptidase M28-like protein [Pedobacter metabolipauper]